MPASLILSNRFDILTDRTPDALERILAFFSAGVADGAIIHSHPHRDGTLAVTIVVKKLAEGDARAIQSGLKHKAFVRDARLEHIVG